MNVHVLISLGCFAPTGADTKQSPVTAAHTALLSVLLPVMFGAESERKDPSLLKFI